MGSKKIVKEEKWRDYFLEHSVEKEEISWCDFCYKEKSILVFWKDGRGSCIDCFETNNFKFFKAHSFKKPITCEGCDCSRDEYLTWKDGWKICWTCFNLHCSEKNWQNLGKEVGGWLNQLDKEQLKYVQQNMWELLDKEMREK